DRPARGEAVRTKRADVHSLTSAIQQKFRHHQANRGGNLETHTGKAGANIQSGDLRNLALQGTRIRSHVINSSDSPHNLRVLHLGNAVAGPLDNFFQSVVRCALRKIVRVGAALTVEISDQELVVCVRAEVG